MKETNTVHLPNPNLDRGIGLCRTLIAIQGMIHVVICVSTCGNVFQTRELEYMTWGFILKDENRSELGPGIRDRG